MSNISAEYAVIGAALALLLGSFFALIVAPALSAYGRLWEKLVAALLSLFVLLALVSVGAGIGFAVAYNWDTITEIF